MVFDYAKDNMERLLYEFYMEQYRQTDPIEISNRLGIVYDLQKSEFVILFMGVDYHISHPDFQVTHEEAEMHFYPLEEDIYAKILVLRYLHKFCFPVIFQQHLGLMIWQRLEKSVLIHLVK